ncbi:MAG: CoA-binding protein [Chitinophagia bacterium]|nr:CoA-binding protein [Chitinophagia bacterium]
MKNKTLILGASDNPSRYSYMALQRLLSHHHEVIAVGRKATTVGEVPITTTPPATDEVDTVTLYVNPEHQKEYYDYLLSLKPRRIIFNPGTENPELEQLAEANGIQAQEACTLVLLGTGQY